MNIRGESFLSLLEDPFLKVPRTPGPRATRLLRTLSVLQEGRPREPSWILILEPQFTCISDE